jgi:Lon protease-like protein
MSEALERVRGVRRLPLFPLPVVLFPGVPLPLHVFEPRYRQMLKDIRVQDNLFGLSFFDAAESEQDAAPPVGHLGCAAEVTEVQELPDGRSNILTLGLVRYRVESYVEGTEPYLVGQVSFFEDEAEDEELLGRLVKETSALFLRIARAVRTINDDRAGLPELPQTEPERLSFLIAAAMEMDNEVKLELLELRSTTERLERLRHLLTAALSGYEERARVHEISKGNGHAGKKIDIE